MAPQSSSRRRRAAKASPPPAAPPPPRRGPLGWLAGLPVELWRTFSGLGLVIGALLFAAALTPSLIPRSPLLQGVLSGVCFAIGYALGVLMLAAWEWMQLPLASVRLRRNATWAAAAVAAVVVVRFVWKSAEWQDSIRARMGMPPHNEAEPLTVALVAAVVFVLLLLIARSFRGVGGLVRRWLARYVPERVSMLVGGLAALALFWTLVNGVLFEGFIRLSDRSFQRARRADRAAVPGAQPTRCRRGARRAWSTGRSSAAPGGSSWCRGRRRRRSPPSPGERRSSRSGSMPG